MPSNKIPAQFVFKSVKPRFIVLNEDIRKALDIYSLSLYLTFRYITSYTQDISSVKRSAKFLYTDAKMSRDKFYRCLNILENHGLIYREPENPLNSISVYHVAHDLNTFNTECDPVFDKDTPVFDKDTDHQFFSSVKTLSTYVDKPKEDKKQTLKNPVLQQIQDAYHETFPDLPKVRNVYGGLQKQLTKMINNWPNYQKDSKEFSIDSFKNYLLVMKHNYSWFLKAFPNENGREVKCTLKKLTTEANISKVVNGEFSANN